MAWLTTEQIKTYLGITLTDYDTQIDLYNPVAQNRVESYILPTVIDESLSETLPIGYHPSYARLVFLMLSEGAISLASGNVTSRSFDGESISYGDSKTTDIAKTSEEQLKKFKPLKKRYY